jgi:four helix bundle protein
MADYNLCKRLFEFAVRVLKFLRKLPDTPEGKTITYQLAKSSTSSGSNYEEAQAGSSKADFHNKVNISLKEMRESNYWLRIIKGTFDNWEIDYDELNWLINESKELKLILGTISSKTKK